MTHPLLLRWLIIGKPQMMVLCGYTPQAMAVPSIDMNYYN